MLEMIWQSMNAAEGHILVAFFVFTFVLFGHRIMYEPNACTWIVFGSKRTLRKEDIMKDKMRNRLSAVAVIVAFIMVFCLALTVTADSSYAKSEEWKVVDYEEKATKGGNYYFRDKHTETKKTEDGESYIYTLQYSKGKGAAYKNLVSKVETKKYVSSPGSLLVKGDKAVVFLDYTRKDDSDDIYKTEIYRYNLSNGKSKKLKTIKIKKGYGAPWAKFAVDNKIYMNEDGYHTRITMFDLKSGKYKVLKKGYGIAEDENMKNLAKGRYFVTQHENAFGKGIFTYKTYLNKIQNGKIKQLKLLTKMGRNFAFVGDKVYYASYQGKSRDVMNSVKVYRCRLNGKKTRFLGKFKKKKLSDIIAVGRFTAKKCKLSDLKNDYTLTYKNKKVKKTGKVNDNSAPL